MNPLRLLVLLVSLLLVLFGGCEKEKEKEEEVYLAEDLCRACSDGDLRGATSAIRAGANVNTQDCGGYNMDSPLIRAVQAKSKEIVELLIENGADVNLTRDPYKHKPLDWAIQYNYSEIIDILRKHGAETKYSDEEVKRRAELPPKLTDEEERQQAKIRAEKIKKAAEAGDAEAQVELGGIYVEGKVVERDFKEAAKWFKKSSDQGYFYGQYNLGEWHRWYGGNDKVKAYKWLYIAKENTLGLSKEELLQIEQNAKIEKAYEKLSAEAGSTPQEELKLLQQQVDLSSDQQFWKVFGGDELTKGLKEEMSPEQIAEAEKLAKELIRENPTLIKNREK